MESFTVVHTAVDEKTPSDILGIIYPPIQTGKSREATLVALYFVNRMYKLIWYSSSIEIFTEVQIAFDEKMCRNTL